MTLPRDEPLRVAVLLDGLEQPGWVHRTISDVQRSTIARVVLVVDNAMPPSRSRLSVTDLIRDRPAFLSNLYTMIDDKVFGRPDDALAPSDTGPLLRDVEYMRVAPEDNGDYLDFPSDQAARIIARSVDIALQFGFSTLGGRALSVARYGMWSYQLVDSHRRRSTGPAGFWQVMERSTITEAVLVMRRSGGVAVLDRTFSATEKMSVRRNRSKALGKCAGAVMRAIRRVGDRGADALSTVPGDSTVRSTSGGGSTVATNRAMTRSLASLGLLLAKHKLVESVTSRQWLLGYQRTAGSSDLRQLSRQRFHLLVPPSDRAWADPFPVVHDGRSFLFVEEVFRRTGRGHISVMELADDGTWGMPAKVLEGTHHLSYPFVFEWQQRYFLVPESCERREVQLFRCVRFPDVWEPESILLTGINAVDPTIMEVDGLWWMFVAVDSSDSGAFEELHLFSAPEPIGPWLPHPLNPVKSDARGSRPAGRVFEYEGALYRPGQDGSKRYGHAICFFRIEQMDAEAYAEVHVATIPPTWLRGLLATHTFNEASGLTVVDGLVRRSCLGWPARWQRGRFRSPRAYSGASDGERTTSSRES